MFRLFLTSILQDKMNVTEIGLKVLIETTFISKNIDYCLHRHIIEKITLSGVNLKDISIGRNTCHINGIYFKS